MTGDTRRRCVVLLQNAWSPEYAGRRWPRRLWLKAFHASRSGRRLAGVFDGCSVWYDNTTREVAASSTGRLRPDVDHVRRILDREAPSFVVACGRQAWHVTTRLWTGRMILMPHPSWRLMSNKLLDVVRGLVAADEFHRVLVWSVDRDTVLVDRW